MHNKTDLEILETLVRTARQIAADRAQGLIVNAEPTLQTIEAYIADAREEGHLDIHCDGISDLPFPPAMRAVIPPSEIGNSAIRVVMDGQELNFCSKWCFLGRFLRTENIIILSTEDALARKN